MLNSIKYVRMAAESYFFRAMTQNYFLLLDPGYEIVC
jgi:hypothetical protein